MIFPRPNSQNSTIQLASKYLNVINGEPTASLKERYFQNYSPITGQVYTEVARSDAADVDLALDAAETALPHWSRLSVEKRANLLLAIAERMEQHQESLAIVETWDNGKPIRETLHADLPLAIDHFRYFAGCLRAEEGQYSELDQNTICIHRQEAIGVVGLIIPWNFPLLMAAWKLAPALAAGCTCVLKPAEQTPISIMVLMEILADILPPGVVNVIQGFGPEAGKALAHSPRISKIAFTGSTAIGQEILKAAAERLIPATVELGGKSPNLFFDDILNQEKDYIDKAVEGVLMAFLNQGEICTSPSRALIQKSLYEPFMAQVLERTQRLVQGNPLDTDTMIGAQVSAAQMDRILSYINIGIQEGAINLIGGSRCVLASDLKEGYYLNPTILFGNNQMRIFQEEIFGPILSLTTFDNEKEALSIANSSRYGLGAGIWTKNMERIHRLSQSLQVGRLWVNCYHQYPAHAAFGGYKASGIGRETHKIAIKNYQQTKNIIINHNNQPAGLF